jgi:hypothetical protein
MTAPEQTDFEDRPAHIGDPVREAISNLLVVIIENTVEGSQERAKAMSEALAAHERIRAALAPKPTIN